MPTSPDLAGGALWLTETLAIGELAPADCRWCDSNTLDDAARELEWGDQETARRISDASRMPWCRLQLADS